MSDGEDSKDVDLQELGRRQREEWKEVEERTIRWEQVSWVCPECEKPELAPIGTPMTASEAWLYVDEYEPLDVADEPKRVYCGACDTTFRLSAEKVDD